MSRASDQVPRPELPGRRAAAHVDPAAGDGAAPPAGLWGVSSPALANRHISRFGPPGNAD